MHLLGAVLLAVLSAIDAHTHRLPDALTLPALPVAALAATLVAWDARDPGIGLTCLLAGALLGGGYLVLALVAPGGGLGLGDVKLAGVIGVVLGLDGWHAVLLGTYAAFLVGGVAALVLVLRGADRRTRIAFGPAMSLGALVGALA